MRLRPVLAVAVLLLLPTACGDHSSSSGPAASPTGPSTQHPASRRPLRSTVSRVGLTRWRLPYPVARAAVIDVGRGSVILAGGLLGGDRSTDHAVHLDLGSGIADRLPRLAVPVHDTAGGRVAGVPTVVGGGNSTEQSVVQSLRHRRWQPMGHLPTARSDLGMVEWRRSAYVIGGFDGTSVPRSILRLTSGAAPRRVGDLVHGVRYAALARIRSDVYVFGGEVAGHELGAIQRVDLATGHTDTVGRLPIPLGHAMAVPVGDRVLLMGGRVSPGRQSDVMWWFDPRTRHLRRAGRLPVPLSDAGVASSGRRVWLLGGETPEVSARVVAVSFR